MRAFSIIIGVVATLAYTMPAAADGLKLAVVAPTDGPYAILGAQVLAGARMALASVATTPMMIEKVLMRVPDMADLLYGWHRRRQRKLW